MITHEISEKLRTNLAIAYRSIERAQEEFPDGGNLEKLSEIAELMEWVRLQSYEYEKKLRGEVMIVIDLIEKLAEFPPDMPVYCYEDGVMELFPVEWVGEMANITKEGIEDASGVVIHHSQPSSKGGWIARA